MGESGPAGGAHGAIPVHVVRVRAIESTFRLETAESELAERLRVEWSRCLVNEPATDEIPLAIDPRGHSLDSLTYAIASQITRRAIEAQIGRYLMFHACGLVDDSGRTAVLVGPSGAGKTTAAATLAREHFGYLTDEAVVIAEDGRVVPYPKPLSRVKSSAGKAQVSPDELVLGSCPLAPRISALILLDRARDGEVDPRLERVPMLDALLELLPQTSGLPSTARPLQRLCEVIDRCGGVYRLTYSQVSRVAPLLRDLLANRPDPIESWSAIPSVSTPASAASGLPRAPGVMRHPVLDAVQVGDEAILLHGRLPVRLSGVGLTIWLEADGGVDLPHLIDVAVREHGPHPAAGVKVRSAVGEMLDIGVLELTTPDGAEDGGWDALRGQPGRMSVT